MVGMTPTFWSFTSRSIFLFCFCFFVNKLNIIMLTNNCICTILFSCEEQLIGWNKVCVCERGRNEGRLAHIHIHVHGKENFWNGGEQESQFFFWYVFFSVVWVALVNGGCGGCDDDDDDVEMLFLFFNSSLIFFLSSQRSFKKPIELMILKIFFSTHITLIILTQRKQNSKPEVRQRENI